MMMVTSLAALEAARAVKMQALLGLLALAPSCYSLGYMALHSCHVQGETPQ